MPTAKLRACTILSEFDLAQSELVGKAVVLTDGKAGTVDRLWLDEFHGLRVSIKGHEGKWPVSTIKFAEHELPQASDTIRRVGRDTSHNDGRGRGASHSDGRDHRA
jgi:hypothetical protein